MKSHFYLATKNINKIKEARQIIGASGIDVLPCPEEIALPEETGQTFEENAFIKAAYLRKFFSREPVAGEDSGLAVEKLNGLPGINSARYAGIHGNDKKNIEKLLDILSSYKDSGSRKAKFITVISFIDGEGEHLFRGEVEGFITFIPRGKNGFGYDPVFEVPFIGKTFAELSACEKNKISHRAAAFKKLAAYLLKQGKKR